jgi:hypothetical protein
MKKVERPSLDEVQQLSQRLHRKSMDEVIGLLGQPSRDLGPTKYDARYRDGRTESVEISRRLEFVGVGTTIYRVVVCERTDGKREFEYHGRESA